MIHPRGIKGITITKCDLQGSQMMNPSDFCDLTAADLTFVVHRRPDSTHSMGISEALDEPERRRR